MIGLTPALGPENAGRVLGAVGGLRLIPENAVFGPLPGNQRATEIPAGAPENAVVGPRQVAIQLANADGLPQPSEVSPRFSRKLAPCDSMRNRRESCAGQRRGCSTIGLMRFHAQPCAVSRIWNTSPTRDIGNGARFLRLARRAVLQRAWRHRIDERPRLSLDPDLPMREDPGFREANVSIQSITPTEAPNRSSTNALLQQRMSTLC